MTNAIPAELLRRLHGKSAAAWAEVTAVDLGTLTTVAEHFGAWPAVISCLERGTPRDDDLAYAYRDWLTAA
ncbi:hypothetical protein ABZY02_36035 [Streptomyces sp. NPDC006649]|uniref:hypothetical protein n=1 Tax=Streptomyces sp. NPDC006649 TaxID=3156896 RepID=UPI0033A8F008